MPPPSSHPLSKAAQAEHDADESTSVEVHREDDVSIIITQSPGFLCHIEGHARVHLPPTTLWTQCIVHPDNAAIFRHLDACSYRKVHSDNGAGRRRVEVVHEASWRFLVFSGKFCTRLMVDEDHELRVMKFDLLPHAHERSILSKFHGQWRVDAHPKDRSSSLSTLDQELALGIWMPPPFDRVLKGICARQVRNIFEDLQREASRINAGRSTLAPYHSVKDKEIWH